MESNSPLKVPQRTSCWLQAMLLSRRFRGMPRSGWTQIAAWPTPECGSGQQSGEGLKRCEGKAEVAASPKLTLQDLSQSCRIEAVRVRARESCTRSTLKSYLKNYVQLLCHSGANGGCASPHATVDMLRGISTSLSQRESCICVFSNIIAPRLLEIRPRSSHLAWCR